MIRECDVCGSPYEARLCTSRFCGSTCRSRASRRRAAGEVLPSVQRGTSGVTDATRAELEARGLAGTADGAVALALAGRIDIAIARGESGSSLAALSRAFRATLRALAGPAAADPIDQLRARRESRWRPRPGPGAS